MWQKMANAEQGSAVHRLYKFGKRLLDSVPAEERLMRGVPKNVSKVIIHHPTQVRARVDYDFCVFESRPWVWRQGARG